MKAAIAQFELHTGLKVYRLSYLSDSSVKLESKAKAWKVESLIPDVAFLRNTSWKFVQQEDGSE